MQHADYGTRELHRQLQVELTGGGRGGEKGARVVNQRAIDRIKSLTDEQRWAAERFIRDHYISNPKLRAMDLTGACGLRGYDSTYVRDASIRASKAIKTLGITFPGIVTYAICIEDVGATVLAKKHRVRRETIVKALVNGIDMIDDAYGAAERIIEALAAIEA